MKNSELNSLVKVVLTLKTSQDVREFLQGILTPKELLEISTRLEIVKQLKAGIPQHKIAENLGVGVATVTRGSKEIQKGRFSSIK